MSVLPYSFSLPLLLASCASVAGDSADSGDSADGADADCFAEDPTALIGTGETTFIDLAEGDEVHMEHGSQGGEHILGSLRLWHTDGIAIVHYTITRTDNGALVSDQTFRVAMIPEGTCAFVYPGMYGYLGFASEATMELQNTPVILQMDATDSVGRHAADEVGVLIGMNDPVSE